MQLFGSSYNYRVFHLCVPFYIKHYTQRPEYVINHNTKRDKMIQITESLCALHFANMTQNLRKYSIFVKHQINESFTRTRILHT